MICLLRKFPSVPIKSPVRKKNSPLSGIGLKWRIVGETSPVEVDMRHGLGPSRVLPRDVRGPGGAATLGMGEEGEEVERLVADLVQNGVQVHLLLVETNKQMHESFVDSLWPLNTGV